MIPEVRYAVESCGDCTSAATGFAPIAFPYFPTRLPGGGISPDVILPGDVELFTYDAGGRLLTADNRHARVSRGYAPNGALTRDTLRIRQYDPTEMASGTPFNDHVFAMANRWWRLLVMRAGVQGANTLRATRAVLAFSDPSVWICTTTRYRPRRRNTRNSTRTCSPSAMVFGGISRLRSTISMSRD